MKKENVLRLTYSRWLLRRNLAYHKDMLRKAKLCLKRNFDDEYWSKKVKNDQKMVDELTEALKILNQYH